MNDNNETQFIVLGCVAPSGGLFQVTPEIFPSRDKAQEFLDELKSDVAQKGYYETDGNKWFDPSFGIQPVIISKGIITWILME